MRYINTGRPVLESRQVLGRDVSIAEFVSQISRPKAQRKLARCVLNATIETCGVDNVKSLGRAFAATPVSVNCIDGMVCVAAEITNARWEEKSSP